MGGHAISFSGDARNARIGFIGAGKVGFSLGRYLADNGCTVAGYSSHTFAHAEEAAAFTDSRAFASPANLAAESDVIAITTPDGAIASVCADLANARLEGKVVCHCSGSLSADVLAAARACGAQVCSVHPLLAVSNRMTSHESLASAVFTLEGDAEALRLWSAALDACGNACQTIAAGDKVVYHAAAVFASNLVCGLMECSVELLESCGFSREGAQAALRPLFVGNATALAEVGPAAALTGPVERNDAATVQRHVEALAALPDAADALRVYRSASAVLASVAQAKHPHRDYGAIRALAEQ